MHIPYGFLPQLLGSQTMVYCWPPFPRSVFSVGVCFLPQCDYSQFQWCLRDIAPEGRDLAETNANLDKVVELAMKLQEETGIRPLWGTAQLFKHPRYMHGAATSTWAIHLEWCVTASRKGLTDCSFGKDSDLKHYYVVSLSWRFLWGLKFPVFT